jgi:hypothetical protein
MKRILEKHPGELMVLAFLAMGVGFLLLVAVGELLSGLGGVGYPGLLDGADWQSGAFPPH